MQLTLSKRLAIGTGALLAIIFATTAISVRSLSSVDQGVRDLSQNWLPSVQLAGAAQEQINLARNFELLHVVAEAPAEMTELASRYATHQREAASLLAKYEEHVSDANEREIYRKVGVEFKDYQAAGERVLEHSQSGRKKEAAELVRGEVARMYLELSAEVDHLVEFNRKGADEAGEHADRVYAAARVEILGFAMVGLAIGVASALMLIRSIRRPIARVVEALEAVADHDLSHAPLTMTIDDEIGRLARATDSMCGKLKVIISQVAASSDEVAAASTQVAAASEELATTVKTQEESASQVSSAVTELSSSVAEVAAKATEASGAAESSRKRADDGGRLVDRTVDQLGAITGRFSEAATVIAGLESQGAEVGRIAEVIEDIAEQTNLLALNAAIEAARAGEQGRGFAIVADEVRKLASRTAKATGEVSVTIGAMRSGTQKAAETMAVGRATVEEGRTLGARAGEAVRGIVQAQQGAETTSLAIAAASQQQASATEEIARSLEQMSAANAQSASAAMQSSCAANALSRQAEELKRVISQFKLV